MGLLGVIVVFFGTGEGPGLDEVWVAVEPPFGPRPEAPPPVPVPAPPLELPEMPKVVDWGKPVVVPFTVPVAVPFTVPVAVPLAVPVTVPVAPVEVTAGSVLLLLGIPSVVKVKLSPVEVPVGKMFLL